MRAKYKNVVEELSKKPGKSIEEVQAMVAAKFNVELNEYISKLMMDLVNGRKITNN